MRNTDFRSWLLETMRLEYKKWANDREWLEIDRALFADTMLGAIKHIVRGGTLLLATDERREWFGTYALSRFYYSGTHRPLLPIFSLNRLLGTELSIQKSSIDNTINMLDIAYGDYMFWYVGQINNHIADLCRSKEYGLFWVMDEGIRGAFALRANDEFLDYKLIEMLRLFEKALYESIFNRVVIE